MKKLTLLSCIVAGLFSTAVIAETISGEIGGSTGKAVGSITGGAVGSGVGAGAGAVEGTLKAPATGVKSAKKCVNVTCPSYVLQQVLLTPLLSPCMAS